MLIRYATLALSISVLGTPPAWAQPAPKLTYFDKIIDLTELISPPPPVDSDAWKEDLDGVLEVQQNRTDARFGVRSPKKCLQSTSSTRCLGRSSTLVICRLWTRSSRGCKETRGRFLSQLRTLSSVQRPITVSKLVLKLGGTPPRLPTGYPSGGTVFTMSTAILLAKMIPEKRFDLFERDREYGKNRILIGEHFPRDIRAGEIAATVIVHALMEKPAFMRDLEAARVELRQVLGYPAEPDPVGSVKLEILFQVPAFGEVVAGPNLAHRTHSTWRR